MGIVESVRAVMWARKRQPGPGGVRGREPAMGATAVVVMNVSGADPLGAIRLYGQHVLPELRG